MLTLKANRVCGFLASLKSEQVLGECGSSPEDFAVIVLGKWLTGQVQFDGPPEQRYAFLSTVMKNDILDTLKKRNVKVGRQGKTVPFETLVEDPFHGSAIESLGDIRQLIRNDAFRLLLEQHTQDDRGLQDFVYAVTEWDGDGVPAPREIAGMLGVGVTEVQNRKRKLARRLTKAGLQMPQTGRQP